MGKTKISKSFDFCYGHRVWSQKLNGKFSIDSLCACRHLHGHQGKIVVYLKQKGGKTTDGMVTDFKHLGFFKKFIDSTFDHKMILDISDPVLHELFPLLFIEEGEGKRGINKNLLVHENDVYYPNLDKLTTLLYLRDNGSVSNELLELYEGLVLVNFVPTSENIAKYMLKFVNSKVSELGVICCKIDFFETPKSQSSYKI